MSSEHTIICGDIAQIFKIHLLSITDLQAGRSGKFVELGI